MKGQQMREETGSKNRIASETGTASPVAKSIVTVNLPTESAAHGQALARGSTPGSGKLFLAALASGLLLGASYFPLAWGWSAWFALVPFLLLVRTQVRPSWCYFCAWVAGTAFYWPILSWMPEADYRQYYTWAMLAFYCSLYFPVALWLLRIADRRTSLPVTFTLPVVWAALEFVRSFLITGFGWYFLGHSQHEFLTLIQVADFGGVYAVTFLVAMVNGLLFEWLFLLRPVRLAFRLPEPAQSLRMTPLSARFWQALAVGALLVAALAYGQYRLQEAPYLEGPRLAMLQGNIDQRLRNEASSGNENADQTRKTIIHHYDTLCKLASRHPDGIDLIVWPETSFPSEWIDTNPAIPFTDIPQDWMGWHIDSRDMMRNVAKMYGTNLLIGINSQYLRNVDEKPLRYNSALLLQDTGAIGGKYNKIHRVPFGEYVPLREQFSFMNRFAPYDFDYSIRAGEEFTRFQLNLPDKKKKYTFGVLICYEDSDPFLARHYGVQEKDGPPVDFLLNISNDGWFNGSSEHNEHLAVSRFRAIETRRSIARAVNMGISAVVDSNGVVMQPYQDGERTGNDIHAWEILYLESGIRNMPLGQWNHFKQSQGILTAIIPIDNRTSLYSLWGDWFACTCWGLIGLTLLFCLARRKTPQLAH